MVIPEQAVPAFFVKRVLPFRQTFFQLHKGKGRQVPLFLPLLLVQTDVLELKHHREFASVGVAVFLRDLRRRSPGFTDCDEVSFLECLPAQFTQKLVELGAVIRDPQIRLFCDLVDHIQTESAHASVHPPEDHVIDFSPYLRVLPVQVRLLGSELMEIILLYFRHPLPRRTAEHCLHVIRINSFLAIPPHIIIMIRIIPALLCLLEPPVFIGSVVEHQVHDDADLTLPSLSDQFIHILKRPEHGINVLIIRNIIPIVILRRAVHRRDPHRVDPQVSQIVKPPYDPPDIPDAVPVRVLEALRINLVYDCVFPPFFILICHTQNLSSLICCDPGIFPQYPALCTLVLSYYHTLRISVPFGFSTPSEKFRANRTSPPGAVCTSSSEQFSRTSIFLFSSSSLIYSTHRLFPY